MKFVEVSLLYEQISIRRQTCILNIEIIADLKVLNIYQALFYKCIKQNVNSYFSIVDKFSMITIITFIIACKLDN